MITFARSDNTSNRFSTIPKQVDSRFTYFMYCNDVFVGTTYGIAVKRLEVKTPLHETYQFDVDLLKRIQKRNISAKDILKFATKV